MSEHQLRMELERLASRLARIERHLQITDESAPLARPPVAPSQPPAPSQIDRSDIGDEKAAAFGRLRSDWESAPVVADASAAGQPAVPPIARVSPAPVRPPITAPPVVRAAPPIQPPSQRPPLRAPWAGPDELADKDTPLELLIGGKWMAWVGAIGVVIAAGFAIKIGIDRGVWGSLPAGVRCLIIAALGGLLLLAGEVALRTIGKAASAGLFSAGLGTLYLDCFATFRFFDLLTKDAAFLLMAIVAAGGFALTWRTRFLSIGVLSILGGYLTPLLLRGQSTHDLELLAYLTMLLGVSLALSAISPRPFRMLRYVALGGQAIVGLGWMLANGSTLWMMAIIFLSVWWTMVLAEAVLAAMRRQTWLGNVVMCLAATAGYATAGCWILNRGPAGGSAWLGIFTLMIALMGIIAAVQFGPGLDVLRGRLANAMDKLALALWAQSGALLAVAAALQFDDYGQSAGWLAIGLAAIEVGRRLPSRGVTIFGLIVGALAVARVVGIDWWISSALKPVVATLAGVTIKGWAILALLTIIAVHVAAHRLQNRPAGVWPRMPALLAGLATVMWMGLCVVTSDGLTTTGGWLAAAIVLLVLWRIGARQRYLEISLMVLFAAAPRWLSVDAFAHRLDPQWQAGEMMPLLNAQMGMAAAIAVVAWWAYRVARKRWSVEPDEYLPQPGRTMGGRAMALAVPAWEILLPAAPVFALIALSFEVDRGFMRMQPPPDWLAVWADGQALSLLLTMLWAFGGVMMVLIGRRAGRVGSMAAAGWLIAVCAALAWLTHDTLMTRLMAGPAAAVPIANLQFAAGVFVAMMLGAATWLVIPAIDQSLRQPPRTLFVALPLALIAAMGLWAGSLEIDRVLADSPMTRQAALSVYWGLFGVMLVLIGFTRRSAPARYAGLGLLSITAAKVLLVDLASLEEMPRVISSLAAGLLLIATSLVYTKLAPRLLGSEK